jgi:hypothetical protein
MTLATSWAMASDGIVAALTIGLGSLLIAALLGPRFRKRLQ